MPESCMLLGDIGVYRLTGGARKMVFSNGLTVRVTAAELAAQRAAIVGKIQWAQRELEEFDALQERIDQLPEVSE